MHTETKKNKWPSDDPKAVRKLRDRLRRIRRWLTRIVNGIGHMEGEVLGIIEITREVEDSLGDAIVASVDSASLGATPP